MNELEVAELILTIVGAFIFVPATVGGWYGFYLLYKRVRGEF